MTVLLGRGESGSHVTLIFTVNDDSTDLDQQGSLGVGLCPVSYTHLRAHET
mgnify:CR=1 FL=1